jgi:transposase
MHAAVDDASSAPQPPTHQDARVSELEARVAAMQAQYDKLRAAYDAVLHELVLLKRRLFVARAERVDTAQLQLELDMKIAQVEALAATLGLPKEEEEKEKPKPRAKPTGRRNLDALSLPQVRIELRDELLDNLVEEGKARHVGFEESSKLGYERGGMRQIIVARAKYETLDGAGESTVETAEMPPQLLPRGLAAPSLLAHILSSRYCDGLPLSRQEDILAREGVKIDRGSMSRWVDELGGTFGATIVHAMRNEAIREAMCIASDATGIPVQPGARNGGPRRACRRGHYFVLIADRDHIWFEYTKSETSAAVAAMFEGYSGYVQVDAKSVFDILFREAPQPPPDEDGQPPPGGRREVGCWAHARRKFWEAAIAHDAVAREALHRISRIFELDASWRAKPPAEIKRLRDAHLRVHVNAMLVWAASEYDRVRDLRGPLRSALGYVVRQKDALARFLEDGRLRLDNNPAELQLRSRVVLGRKASLFVGSDDHATSAAGVMSLVASARLHGLDPEAYLRDMIRVLAHWPRDRYLELAPKYWAATRARLDAAQLAAEIGGLDVPTPLPNNPEEQPLPG